MTDNQVIKFTIQIVEYAMLSGAFTRIEIKSQGYVTSVWLYAEYGDQKMYGQIVVGELAMKETPERLVATVLAQIAQARGGQL
jgi:hypothetical protein